MDRSAAKLMPSDELLFRDGLGDRLLVRDAQGYPQHEILLIRTDLSSVPSFDFALNERLWLLERFDHPSFLTVRSIVQEAGPLPQIRLAYDYCGGTRLSDMLARAESGAQPITMGAALFIIREILAGLAELHKQSGDLSHGALAAERVVVSNGSVRIADYVLGSAIEQLRYSGERYWKELRIAVPLSAGGVRLDRAVDVAQAAVIAVALFVGRPLRDSEHIGNFGELMTRLSVPSALRNWLVKALHMDSRRVFVSAAEAAAALDEAIAESGLRPDAGDLDQLDGRPRVAAFKASVLNRPASIAPPPTPAPVVPKPMAPAAPKPVAPTPAARPAQPAAARPTHDRRSTQGVAAKVRAPRPGTTARAPAGLSPGFHKVLSVATLAILMSGVFTTAQFVPTPDWLFPKTGTLVVDSNPKGIPVLVDGEEKGMTPLTLKIAAGRHQVELRGPGRSRVFNVFVSRGDRVAQYVEFPTARRR